MTKKQQVGSIWKKIVLTILFAAAMVFIASGFVGLFTSFSHFNDSMQSFDRITSMAKRWEGAILLIFSGFVCIVWAVLILNVSRMSKNMKNQAESKVLNDLKIQQKKMEPVQKTTVYCAYCETELFENERDCPNCGASKNKSIKNIEKERK